MKSERVISMVVIAMAPAFSLACIQGISVPAPAPHIPAEFFTSAPKVKIDVSSDAAGVPSIALQQPAISIDLKPVYESIVATHKAAPKKHATLADRTDFAAALIYLGRYREAIDEMLAMEKKFPGVYSTATNLGTAYELNGELKEARRWIAEGIKRNPASHEGTEWLHVAILDAKLALRNDSKWLEKNSVLAGNDKRSSDEVLRAIVYQLNERLTFVSPPDATVADLFYQAGLRATTPDSRSWFLDHSLAFSALRKAEIAQLQR